MYAYNTCMLRRPVIYHHQPFYFFSRYVNFCYSMRLFDSAYLVSPCSSAPFRWGRRSCLGLRTGVSPHFSMNSMREILALRGGYERGRVPLPSPMPPESGAPPHNTHPSMVPLSVALAVLVSTLLCSYSRTISCTLSIAGTPFQIVLFLFSSRYRSLSSFH